MLIIWSDSQDKILSELLIKQTNARFSERLVSELNYKETKEAELYSRLEDWYQANRLYKKLITKEYDSYLCCEDSVIFTFFYKL